MSGKLSRSALIRQRILALLGMKHYDKNGRTVLFSQTPHNIYIRICSELVFVKEALGSPSQEEVARALSKLLRDGKIKIAGFFADRNMSYDDDFVHYTLQETGC